MTRPDVLIVDPGCFTPGYDRGLAGGLKQAGWSVELITSEHEFEPLEELPGIPTRRLFASSRRDPRSRGSRHGRRLRRAVGYPIGLLRLDQELHRRAPGILHVQWAHVPSLDGIFWRRWQQAGWSIVYTAHDVQPLRGTTPRAFARAHRRLVAHADAVVVHYEAARRELVGVGVPVERIHVIAPGPPVEADPTLASRARARRALALDPDAPVVLFFGFVKPYKGLDVLLRSLPAVRAVSTDATLVVAGEIVGSQHRYDGLARRIGVGDAIRWRPGFVANGDLAGLFAAADVVVLPYLAASSSGVLLTAYAFRRPVVASTVGGLADLVDDGDTGVLVPPHDPSALAAAIAEVLRDRARAEDMGNRGHALLHSRHSWAGVAARLDTLYRELAA